MSMPSAEVLAGFLRAHGLQLNAQQQAAVGAVEGAVLLLAVPGSGKTTVLVTRLGYLVQCCNVRPEEILTMTYTVAATRDMRNRFSSLFGEELGSRMEFRTINGVSARIIRAYEQRMGRTAFSLLSSEAEQTALLRVLYFRCKGEYPTDAELKQARTLIAYAKNQMLGKEELDLLWKELDCFPALYRAYQQALRNARQMDYDDQMVYALRILRQVPEILHEFQARYHYFCVDEAQDTSRIQHAIVSLLAGAGGNLFLVGDEDQSIYGFRAACPDMLLHFEADHPGAKVLFLEQNYRSTGNILEAANAVIRNNRGRKGKNLWTDHGEGEKVQFYTAGNEREEGMYVATQLLRAYGEGKQWKDCAVLYRMNALSNQIEMALKSNSIPYRVVGGFRFFERAEVKDMLSYLCVIHNPQDDLRLLRVVNNPPRGIGAKTMEHARGIAAQEGRSLWDVLSNAGQIPALKKAAPKFQTFVDLIRSMQRLAEEVDLPTFYETLIQASGYGEMLSAKTDHESKSRLENIHELSSSISGYLEHAEDPSLGGFLDEVALYTDLDSVEEADNCVTLMTMHAAKGLEFPVVFTVGMEEGVFPGFRAIGEEEELEEERRLCYVALTRAKERLYLTCAAQRMLFGRTSANLPSRFVQEIPAERVQAGGKIRRPQQELLSDTGWSGEERFSQVQRPAAPQPARPSGTRAAPAAYRKPAPKAQPMLDLRKGDMVRHSAFGTGMVLTVQSMGGDALLEVAFDNVGTKRMMLKAASQFMTKES